MPAPSPRASGPPGSSSRPRTSGSPPRGGRLRAPCRGRRLPRQPANGGVCRRRRPMAVSGRWRPASAAYRPRAAPRAGAGCRSSARAAMPPKCSGPPSGLSRSPHRLRGDRGGRRRSGGSRPARVVSRRGMGPHGRPGSVESERLWRLHGSRESWELRAEFLALRPESAPRRLGAAGGPHRAPAAAGGACGCGRRRRRTPSTEASAGRAAAVAGRRSGRTNPTTAARTRHFRPPRPVLRARIGADCRL